MKSKINTQFGLKIVELRKNAGISQDELAFRSEIHRAYMGTIERGEKSVTLNTIEKIAKGLGVKVKDLFDWED
jgi:transcriptional regulator with XRE-family HTH domain